MGLEKELNEIIKKSLPQHVGETLRERLEQANKDEEENKSLKEELAENYEKISEQRSIIEEYKKFYERNKYLNRREKELEAGLIKLEIETLKYQLETEKEKTDFTKIIALGLVRNTQYKKTIFDTENKGGVPMQDGHGNFHYPMPTSKSHTSTEQAE